MIKELLNSIEESFQELQCHWQTNSWDTFIGYILEKIKKTQFSPLTPSPNQSWLYRHLEQWNNIDWWVVMKGGGGGWDREGLSGISPSYRCGMWYANESLRICVLTSARSSSLYENNMLLLLYFDQIHASIDPCNLVREPFRVRTLFLNKKFKDFSRTFKDTFPIFHFYYCGLGGTTGSRSLNFVLHDQKVYLVFTQNIKTRALGSL